MIRVWKCVEKSRNLPQKRDFWVSRKRKSPRNPGYGVPVKGFQEGVLKGVPAGRKLRVKNMRRPILITTPFPTPEETARVYGISKRRADLIRKSVEISLEKKGISTNGTRSASSKNGANGSGSRSHGLKVKVGAKSRARAKSGSTSRRKPTRGKAKTSH